MRFQSECIERLLPPLFVAREQRHYVRWLFPALRDSVPNPARALPMDPRRALGPFETRFAIGLRALGFTSRACFVFPYFLVCEVSCIMYAFIDGQVCEKSANTLVLLAGGVGYLLNCSMTTLQAAPQTGDTMRCYTWLSVREDAMELYGFATKEEKQLFLSLTSISGVGPKMALGLLGSMPLRDLHLAILLGDITALSRAPGIGKKTAQRIALELKDKISQADVDAPSGAAAAAAAPLKADNFAEAIEALVALGYSSVEARSALSSVKDKDAPVDELIRLALRSMAGM